jgi:hypothetical protein
LVSIQRAIYNCYETWLLSQKLRKSRQKAPGEEPPVIPKIKKVQHGSVLLAFTIITGNYYDDLIHKFARFPRESHRAISERTKLKLLDKI